MTGKTRRFPATEEAASVGVGPDQRLVELYEQHVDFVWRSVRMMGLAADAADDAVQDVFLVAHRRLGDFEARSAPRTWLFAIAVRVVSDHRRSGRRRHRLLERAHRMENEPPETPFDRAVNTEWRTSLLSAIEALPEEQRVVFVLSELEELSAPEIASALGVNLNTIYSRLRAARRTIAVRMREQPDWGSEETA